MNKLTIKDVLILITINIVLYGILALSLYLIIIWGLSNSKLLAFTTLTFLVLFIAFIPLYILHFSKNK